MYYFNTFFFVKVFLKSFFIVYPVSAQLHLKKLILFKGCKTEIFAVRNAKISENLQFFLLRSFGITLVKSLLWRLASTVIN
ncbi:hypothetical protein ASG14_13260 [Pedobacter sp. Leaf194]|nr:hypothetical protein ASG14_13260 [Pedobacter sp. Leaf194]